MKFAEVITQYLKQAKVSAKDMAKALKVKEQDIKDWCNGFSPTWKQMNFVLRKLQFNGTVDEGEFHFEGQKKSNYNVNDPKSKMEYYRSDTWRKISEKRLDMDGHKCALCGSTENLTVHHMTYVHFGGNENPELELLTVCNKCHMKLHGDKTSKQSKELESGRSKVLIVTTNDYKSKCYWFTYAVSDSLIEKYLHHLEKKYKVKYSHWDIFTEDGSMTTDKVKQLIGFKGVV